jgi:hypothetical protein
VFGREIVERSGGRPGGTGFTGSCNEHSEMRESLKIFFKEKYQSGRRNKCFQKHFPF